MTDVAALLTGRLPSPLGTMLLAWDDERRLRALDFQDSEERFERLLKRYHQTGPGRRTPDRPPAEIGDRLAAYFAGEVDVLDSIPVATGGTPFQREIWEALRAIPSGETTTYGRLAAQIGRPSACRAVGAANGANPVVIVVPCHRVIGSDSSLTGYGGGIERKRWLLAHEGRHRAVAKSA